MEPTDIPIKSVRHIGQTIAVLRRKMNITGEELGRRAGMSQSKISKIETGYYAQLDGAEIKRILNILNAPSTILQQVEYVLGAADALGKTHVSPLSVTVTKACLELERASHSIKIYVANAVPALLQTLSYREASLRYKGIEKEEMDAFLKNALQRQDELWNNKHTFHILVPQTVLYTVADSKSGHLAQLDRLERVISIPQVTFGIIPLEAGTVLIEYASFGIYDDHTLVQALSKYEITSHAVEEIELHDDVFHSLASLAFYDEDAMRLIRDAMKFFA